MNQSPTTYYAPVARSTPEEIREEAHWIDQDKKVRELLDMLPEMILLLNSNRQIVHANTLFLQVMGLAQEEDLLGMRPGEALGCLHAHESLGGCGTTESCRHCGAVRAVMEALDGRSSCRECVIDSSRGCQLNLRVTTKPIQFDERNFILVVLTDIQTEKRAQFLERLFLHDILNYAAGIQGIARLLPEAKADSLDELCPLIMQSSDHLVEVIQSHRDLVHAESGDLELRVQPLIPGQIMEHVGDLYQHHRLARGKKIAVIDESSNELLYSDMRLLSRVLGNLVVNALEASQAGETVTMRAKHVEDRMVFSVHNSKVMPRSIQLQLFHRSFSTKGTGRGLGTYSIKLFTEKYLQGKVSFQSDPQQGTRFFVDLPLQIGKAVENLPDKPLVA